MSTTPGLHNASRPEVPPLRDRVVTSETNPAEFERILQDPAFAKIEAYPHMGAFGRAYHAAIHGQVDCSFAIYTRSLAVLVCLCAPVAGKLGFYGMPLALIPRSGLDEGTLAAALDAAFTHLDGIASARGLGQVEVRADDGASFSSIERACRHRNATAIHSPVAWVDLAAGPTAWRAALRKSSRSLVNWGRRNFSISCVNRDTPDRALFERYRDFHSEVAGRVTRSAASWDAMYEWIARGSGELILGYLEGRLVAGSMFLDGTEISIYASGVYDRSLFDKPLGHYPLWLGLEHAHTRGMKKLELGSVPAQGTVSDKEYQIGYFKRGFATHVEDQISWVWSVPQTCGA
jgi:GNAT acetyltransferase-like protein